MDIVYYFKSQIESVLKRDDFTVNEALRSAIKDYSAENPFFKYINESQIPWKYVINFMSPRVLAATLNEEFNYELPLPEKVLGGEAKDSVLIDFQKRKIISGFNGKGSIPSINFFMDDPKSDYTLEIIRALAAKNRHKNITLVEIGCSSGKRLLAPLQNIATDLDIYISLIGIEYNTIASLAFSKNVKQYSRLRGVSIHNGISGENCEHIGNFVNFASPDSAVIISSRMATDPYVQLPHLKSFVSPFVHKIVGAAAYELDGMMLLKPNVRRSLALYSWKHLGIPMFPPKVNAWGVNDPEDDYFNINSNRKPNSYELHRYICSQRPELEHTFNVPVQIAYSHPGYDSFLQ